MRREKAKNLTIDEIHSAFDRTCRANGLRDSLSHRALLNAVRYHGIIQWYDSSSFSHIRPLSRGGRSDAAKAEERRASL